MVLWYSIGFVLFLIFLCEIYAWKTGIPTVTSSPSVRKKMIELLKAEAERRGSGKPFTILDLGSGTGKLTLQIGRALPEARVLGLEISIVPYLLSQTRRFFWRVKNVTYERKDFWSHDLSGVDAVVLFITEKVRERMARKLEEGLPVGALVISNETHLPGWEPFESHKVGLLRLKVVAYRKENVSGGGFLR